jgi:D-alanyl-D-alanine carboxypeptidase/D-alanyl-D-alanine-endopeptidase (penicillin-binding protein 4)
MRVLCLLFTLLSANVSAASDDAQLPPIVQAALNVRQVPPDSLSVFVQDVESGEILLRWNEDVVRNPASSIKLLTTLVALDVLGPAYSWKTDVYVLGELENGRLKGDLLLKGYGDPFLVTERVWQLLRRVRQLGIREIEGNLQIDDSYFYLPEADPAEFDHQPLRAYNVTPNAMLMNFKVVRYWFEPNFDANNVHVWLDPPLENVAINNRLALAAGSCRGYQRGITISANEAIDKMTFSGKFPSGCKQYAMDRTALSHNEFVYGLFISLWRESGGTFKGGWMNRVAPDDIKPMLSFPSLPLADVITYVNKHSNNVMARQLILTLSAEVLGQPGTEEGGRQVVADWLADRGFDTNQLVLTNGAGLSRDTRISARDMGALLEFAWRQPYMPEFVSSMSLAGMDGTTRRRFDDASLDGSAHLKTGSLDDVTAIAGYLQARSGRRFAVVTMHNHKDIHRGPGQEVQESVLRWVYEH